MELPEPTTELRLQLHRLDLGDDEIDDLRALAAELAGDAGKIHHGFIALQHALFKGKADDHELRRLHDLVIVPNPEFPLRLACLRLKRAIRERFYRR